jgi:hypothetical protein
VHLPGIAASLGITERSAHGIVTGLAEAGRIVKLEDGRRNRYQSPGTPAAARTHPAGTHLRRSPGQNWRRAVPDAERASQATSRRPQPIELAHGPGVEFCPRTASAGGQSAVACVRQSK